MFIKLFWFYHHAQVKSPLETEARPSPVRSCLTTRHNRRGGKKERERKREGTFYRGRRHFPQSAFVLFFVLDSFQIQSTESASERLNSPLQTEHVREKDNRQVSLHCQVLETVVSSLLGKVQSSPYIGQKNLEWNTKIRAASLSHISSSTFKILISIHNCSTRCIPDILGSCQK